MAQNIPDLLTVSLHTHTWSVKTTVSNTIEPAVNCNGFVASSNLNFDNLINDISHCLDVGAATIRSPVSDVELTHIEGLTRLYT